jgi:PKHD-type hydroxylase
MLLHIPNVLSKDQVAQCLAALAKAPWEDGRVTAGYQSAKAKDNDQVPQDSETAHRLGEVVVGALNRCPLFISAALPHKVYPPMFNRYGVGKNFGGHVDNAIRSVPGTPVRVRTDLSATLFLSAPEDYDGGELDIEDTFGVHSVKLPAGDMILYPATSLHNVRPVTRGARLASFLWIQSMVRDDGERTLLYDMDCVIGEMNRTMPDSPAAVKLMACYHNLLRRWADA